MRGALEIGPEGVALMLVLDLFRGPAAAEARRLADTDGDGALSADERARLGRALAEKALAGFAARLDGEVMTFAPVEWKADALDWSARTDAPVSAAVWLQSAGRPPKGRRILTLARGTPGADPPVDLVVQAVDGAQIAEVRGARRSAILGSGPAWRLAAGRPVSIVFEVP